MPGVRDHEPVVIEEFNGWYLRGDPESCPLDHFTVADNVQYQHSSVCTRDPIDKYQNLASPLKKIVRMYDYIMPGGQSLLVLTEGGKIYHVIGSATVHGPILTIPDMQDFGFIAINGRAYITPFKSYADVFDWPNELGLHNEFLYVYKGDGTPARKAAGKGPTNGSKKPFLAYNDTKDGVIDVGIHIIAVAFAGGALGPEVFQVVEAPGEKQIQLANIPLGSTTRTIVMTKAIDVKDYKPDHSTYTYYKVIDITDDVTTSVKISIKDEDLTVAYTPGGGGAPVTGALKVENTDIDGFSDFGFHLIGVIYETDTGYLSKPGPEFFAGMNFVDTKKGIKVSNIPVSPDPFVKKRHLVSTKWIPEYNGDQKGYQFFYIPEGTLDNNTDTEKVVNYYDSDLVDDASHLMDNFSEIPAGVSLCTYHGRLVIVGEYGTDESLEGIPEGITDNRSVARVSAPGEPEAFSKVDGLIVAPLDGNPLTNCQEFRDLLFLFKKTRTIAYSDNEDEPASWIPEKIDEGIGAPVHGVATVLDTGGVNVDFLLIGDLSGFMLFNGTYARPELSWKIENFWMSLDRNKFRYMQIVNDSVSKKIWMTLPPPFQHILLYADYGNGLDPKNIRWARWIFDAKISTLALIETNKLVLGALANAI